MLRDLRLPQIVGTRRHHGLVVKIDRTWAVDELASFLHMTAQVPYADTGGVIVVGTHMRCDDTQAAESAHVVEAILDRVLPRWRADQPENDESYRWLRDKAARARAAIEREAELAAKLGDDAPDMDAANLHPWAWENGRSYWTTGHPHQAVMEAALRINAETQAKVGRRDLSETALFNECFSLSAPKPGSPRLRISEDDGGRTYESLHRGARAFAEGLYAAIRNPGMHEPSGGGEEQLALEQMAAFSLLARWVDQATVERV